MATSDQLIQSGDAIMWRSCEKCWSCRTMIEKPTEPLGPTGVFSITRVFCAKGHWPSDFESIDALERTDVAATARECRDYDASESNPFAIAAHPDIYVEYVKAGDDLS